VDKVLDRKARLNKPAFLSYHRKCSVLEMVYQKTHLEFLITLALFLKTTLFNVFGFLKDALSTDVNTAFNKRGGFDEVISRGSEDNIEFEIKFKAKNTYKNNPIITYFLSIAQKNGKAVVDREILKYRRGAKGLPWEFLNFSCGKGKAVINEQMLDSTEEKDLEREEQTLKSPDILAIKGLAQFEKFPAVIALSELIDNWHVSDIHVNEARNIQQADYAEHLSTLGENLSNVIEYLHNNHKEQLDEIIKVLKQRIPGISNVEAKTIETGQVLLKIQDESFDKPFLVRYISDGTIKMLAYLVLLYDPKPYPALSWSLRIKKTELGEWYFFGFFSICLSKSFFLMLYMTVRQCQSNSLMP
jgi:predicted ATPase